MNDDRISDALTLPYYLHKIYVEAKTLRHLHFYNVNVTDV